MNDTYAAQGGRPGITAGHPSARSLGRGGKDELMKGFDLASALAGVPRLDTSGGREQIEYIPLERIDSDPLNFYALSGLEELAANIELIGLQQPLRVRENPEYPGHVVIVSGHRRRAALQKLADEGRADLREVPCIREVPAASAALQELRLIYANSGTRVLSSAELSRQVERVEELLYQLKEEGMEFPGRMRDHVAEACKVRKVSDYAFQKRQEYIDLLAPYDGKRLVDIPDSVFNKASAAMREAEKADRKWNKIMEGADAKPVGKKRGPVSDAE